MKRELCQREVGRGGHVATGTSTDSCWMYSVGFDVPGISVSLLFEFSYSKMNDVSLLWCTVTLPFFCVNNTSMGGTTDSTQGKHQWLCKMQFAIINRSMIYHMSTYHSWNPTRTFLLLSVYHRRRCRCSSQWPEAPPGWGRWCERLYGFWAQKALQNDIQPIG